LVQKFLLKDGRKVVQFAFDLTQFGRNLFVIVAFFGNFLWWFLSKRPQISYLHGFLWKNAAAKLYFPQNISTEARIHQKSAAWKCAAHFTLVNSAYLELLKSST